MDPATGGAGGAGGSPEAPKDEAPSGCATWQRTSLMIAARHGQFEVVVRALETSCSQPQLDVVDEHGDTALMIAAREGHTKVVDALISAGADLSVRNMDGKSAAELATTDDVRKLIKDGEARFAALEKAILAGAGGAMPAQVGASGGSSSASCLAGLNFGGGTMRNECPF
mmetsp:Transcript_23696/g.32004  ORF Transcript_23696/g.32004 Transcript_23696/m.32004 type:complete len:170 (-) Transcript_23696:113-622(-)